MRPHNAAGAALGLPGPRLVRQSGIMRRRTRKLIGTLAMLLFILVYAPLAMALAEGRIRDAPALVQALAYAVLGLVWVVPLLPLVRWMQRPDRDNA